MKQRGFSPRRDPQIKPLGEKLGKWTVRPGKSLEGLEEQEEGRGAGEVCRKRVG